MNRHLSSDPSDVNQMACLDSSPFPFIIINSEYLIVHANTMAKNTFDIVFESSWLTDILDDTRQPIDTLLPKLNETALFEYRFKQANSKSTSFKTYVRSNSDSARGQVYYIWLEDNRLNEQHDHEMAQLAFVDVVTGCFNRTYLSTVMPFSDFIKYDMTLFYIDVDKFKTINDTYGHSVGDEILKETGTRLNTHTRSADKVIRLGGDEFCVLAFNLIDDALNVGEKLANHLMKAIHTTSGDFTLTHSIGVAKAKKGQMSLETLVNNADIAMYKAKKSALNSCYEYDDSFKSERNPKGFLLKSELLKALNNREIFSVYQPVFNYKNELVALEALARWYNKNQGMITPGVFIPIAEEQHLLSKLDELVLDNVMSFLSKAHLMGVTIKPVHINFSAEHLVSTSFIENLEQKLDANDLSKQHIIIEITESKVYEPLVLKTINQLVDQGFSVYMDDFGTEYSNLKTLSSTSLQVIKFDKSIVDSAILGDFAYHLTEACKSLDKKVLFEGVETEQDMARAIKSQADYIQGFYLSKPVSEEFLLVALKALQNGDPVHWPRTE